VEAETGEQERLAVNCTSKTSNSLEMPEKVEDGILPRRADSFCGRSRKAAAAL
jgi:hypothetical protein